MVLLAGCKVDIPWVDPLDATVSVVEAQEADEWAFFDFHNGIQLTNADGSPLLLDSPDQVSGWDLALSQFVLATSSGANSDWGSESQGTLELVQGSEESPPSIGDDAAQVSCASLHSEAWEADEEVDPDLAGPRRSVVHNVLLTGWFRYRLSSHQAIPNFAVFAVQDRFGRCVRLQVVDYYDDEGESGFVKLYWQYLVD
ncbi:MAG: hypothetical protein CMP23_08740 [Rickettsiales bacterium]|nr:hypothetical protein [Rickettsiales bacterium]|tara:strand:+ start:755 stop:1351 length:597 start_codon:yes stop_codon:yes gene_type:complete